MKLLLIAIILLAGCVKSAAVKTPAHPGIRVEETVQIDTVIAQIVAAAEWEIISSKEAAPFGTDE